MQVRTVNVGGKRSDTVMSVSSATTVGIVDLSGPGLPIEMEMIAVLLNSTAQPPTSATVR